MFGTDIGGMEGSWLTLCQKDVPPCRRKLPESRVRLSVPQIHDVSATAQPYVVAEVPASVVRVLIDHDLVTIPQPIIDEAVVVGGHAKVEALEPITLSVPPASRKTRRPLKPPVKCPCSHGG